MTDRVVIYTPLEDILYNQGGIWMVLAFIVAALAGVAMYSLIERKTRFTRIRAYGSIRVPGTNRLTDLLSRYNGVISIATGVATLNLIHLANLKGWI